MRWSKAKYLPLIVLFAAVSHSAWAQVQNVELRDTPELNKELFSREEIDRLCKYNSVGKHLLVVRERLAWRLIELGRPFPGLIEQNEILRYATYDGSPVKTAGPDQVIRFVSSRDPFALRTIAAYSKEENLAKRAALVRQARVLKALELWFRDEHASNKYYKLDPPTKTGDPGRYFQGEYDIVCIKRATGDAGRDEDQQTAPLAITPKKLIVRQDVADIGATDLKKAKGARLSYDDDVKKGKTAISAEGLVEFVVAGSGIDRATGLIESDRASGFYWFRLVPYVYYKNTHKRPASASSKDIEYWAPGATGELTWINHADKFAFDLQAEASSTIDTANAASIYNLGVRFSPSFYDGSNVWFGGVLGPVGAPILFKPDLSLIARQHFIQSAGTNPELQGIDHYFGLGIDTSLYVYLNANDDSLPKLTGNVGYRYQYNSAGVSDIARFTAGVSYEITSNVSAEMTYVAGRDANTLQQEEKWVAGLTVKY